VIRWEEQPDGNWLGYSGQALVATATKVDENRWDWEVPGAGKPKGWRNSGHRTNELDARRAADAYWDKWLSAAALKPDLGRLAEGSIRSTPRRSARPRRRPTRPSRHHPVAVTLSSWRPRTPRSTTCGAGWSGRKGVRERRRSAPPRLKLGRRRARRRPTSASPGCAPPSANSLTRPACAEGAARGRR
jgi:hypothetical protein